VKRIVAIAAAVIAVVGLGIFLAGLGGARTDRVVTLAETQCQESSSLVLLAQSVPRAQLVPCLTEGAEGWIIAEESYTSDGSVVKLVIGGLSGAEWTITLTASCTPDPGATDRAYPDQQGRYQVVGVESTDPDDGTETDTEWYQFDGGCTTSSVAIPSRFDSQRIFDELDSGFVFAPRSAVAQFVVDESDGRLTLDPPGTTP